MTRLWDKNRRPSTIERDDRVHDAYAEVMEGLGEWKSAVARGEIYRRVAAMVNLTPKTVERIIGHSCHSRLK